VHGLGLEEEQDGRPDIAAATAPSASATTAPAEAALAVRAELAVLTVVTERPAAARAEAGAEALRPASTAATTSA
jgi:hypothetical protein